MNKRVVEPADIQDMNDLISFDELASMFNVKRGTIYNKILNNNIEYYKIFNKCYIKKEDVNKLIKKVRYEKV
jgi:excisionase family DNA binding protein